MRFNHTAALGAGGIERGQEEMVEVAKKNGQSQRYILERAFEHYLHNVVPSQHLVCRGVMDAFEQSVAQNRDLLDRLAR